MTRIQREALQANSHARIVTNRLPWEKIEIDELKRGYEREERIWPLNLNCHNQSRNDLKKAENYFQTESFCDWGLFVAVIKHLRWLQVIWFTESRLFVFVTFPIVINSSRQGNSRTRWGSRANGQAFRLFHLARTCGFYTGLGTLKRSLELALEDRKRRKMHHIVSQRFLLGPECVCVCVCVCVCERVSE